MPPLYGLVKHAAPLDQELTQAFWGQADYTDLGGPVYEALESDEFVAKVSGSIFSNPLLRTQHLHGASKWDVDETHIVGYHQVRSESRILASEKSNEVASESYRWVVVTMTYVKEDGQWKLSGIAPKNLKCVELEI